MILRLSAIVVAAALLASCQHKAGHSHSAHKDYKPHGYVGEITNIIQSKNGIIAEITNRETKQVVDTLVSVPHLQNPKSFQFAYLSKGNVLKVIGDAKKAGKRTMVKANKAYTYSPLTSFAKVKATASERSRCKNLGGKVAPAGMRQADHCHQNLADAGTKCGYHSECLGDCLLPASAQGVKAGQHVVGECAATNIRYGCRALVNNQVFDGTLCLD